MERSYGRNLENLLKISASKRPRFLIFYPFPMNAEFDVRYTAELARIALTDEEVAKFQSQLSLVLEHVEKLKTVDVSGVEPMAHAHQIFNVVREDAPHDYFTPAEALANAPRQAGNLFVVPKVLE